MIEFIDSIIGLLDLCLNNLSRKTTRKHIFQGGLVMPIIVDYEYEDGTTKRVTYPRCG